MIEIRLDPRHPLYSELVKEIEAHLNALTTVKHRQEKRPLPAGTLVPGLEQVVTFIVQDPVRTMTTVTAIVNLIRAILALKPAKGPIKSEGETVHPVEVVAGSDESADPQPRTIRLPATEETAKRFVRSIGEKPKAPRRPSSRKPRRKASKAPSPKRARHRNSTTRAK